jgi:hypothetical protein
MDSGGSMSYFGAKDGTFTSNESRAHTPKKVLQYAREGYVGDVLQSFEKRWLNRPAINQSWAMDFMHDVLADGSKIQLLTRVDIYSRESVGLEVDFGFTAPQVVDALQRLSDDREKQRLSAIAESLNPLRQRGRIQYLCISIRGHIGTASRSTSLGQESHQITVDSHQITVFVSRSTIVSIKNCSIRPGSDCSPMLARGR